MLSFVEQRGSGIDGIDFYTKDSSDDTGSDVRRFMIRRGAPTTLIRTQNTSEFGIDSAGGTGNMFKVKNGVVTTGDSTTNGRVEINNDMK